MSTKAAVSPPGLKILVISYVILEVGQAFCESISPTLNTIACQECRKRKWHIGQVYWKVMTSSSYKTPSLSTRPPLPWEGFIESNSKKSSLSKSSSVRMLKCWVNMRDRNLPGFRLHHLIQRCRHDFSVLCHTHVSRWCTCFCDVFISYKIKM